MQLISCLVAWETVKNNGSPKFAKLDHFFRPPPLEVTLNELELTPLNKSLYLLTLDTMATIKRHQFIIIIQCKWNGITKTKKATTRASEVHSFLARRPPAD